MIVKMGVLFQVIFIVSKVIICYSFLTMPENDARSSGYEYIPALDSDFLFLEVKPSLLPVPGIGDGVFATSDIPAGEIICEFRGPIVDDDIAIDSNKGYNIVHDGKKKKILGNTICSMINDCAAIYGAKYTAEDIKRFKESDDFFESVIPPYDGYRYNAKGWWTVTGKVFVISTELIKAGTEICFSYGK
jgi:hypothetical protein